MEWKRLERQRSPYYRIAEKQFFEALMRQLNPVIGYAEANGMIDAAVVARLIVEEPVYDKFNYVYKETGADFAEKVYSKFAGAGAVRSTFEKFMEDYVRENGGQKITAITNTTKEYARGIINTTINENGTMGSRELGREIAKNIKTKGGEISQWRARMIARTEVATASNVGQQAGAEQTGLPMVKVWIHSGGRDARISHQAMNGQEADVNGYFIFDDGTRMYTPLDPSAPPEHVINCRCSLNYKVRTIIEN